MIACDEYGYNTIHGKFESIEEAITKAKGLVSTDNLDNALTLADKLSDWESYFVEVLDEDGQPTYEAVYGGEEKGKKFVYHFREDGVVKIYLDGITVPVRIYIGTENRGNRDQKNSVNLYAGIPSKKNVGGYDPIDNLTHEALREKALYFIRII